MLKTKSGVYKARKKDNTLYFRVSITYKEKQISLGSYFDEKIANDAFKQANIIISEDITLRDYNPSSSLPFEKWVSLINFRDNNIYFSNPIYLKSKIFYYYLSPEEILKFDIDDLFFYSSHKIMRRGSHMFVANFGSQLNIAYRYGIKPNAVIGRDYIFLNNDPLDFRYSNVEILNKYNGVEIVENDGVTYKAFIHINGNYIIGTYKSIIEAAIAYNKAADILMQKNVNKKYQLNKIEGLSSKDYATIYSEVEISSKIINYLTE